ncbi:alpha/beta hydrolase [Kordiimonas lacus]|nr:alpha/beta hydrolase [Kordiimonas lacus]
MQFANLAEEQKLIILAPLFPSGIADRNDNDNYKYIAYRDIRFDLLLLQMIEEAAALYNINVDRFALFGFSGGAHFAHRFFYLHPTRLSAVSIAAPGSVTLMNPDQDWWVGTRNMEELFGCSLNFPAMRQVPAQLLVGNEDTNTQAITHQTGRGKWMPGANGAGTTRIDRLYTLYENWRSHDLNVTIEEIAGVGHSSPPLADPAAKFFTKHMRE